jgi:thiamine biosynthesis lipoprotein
MSENAVVVFPSCGGRAAVLAQGPGAERAADDIRRLFGAWERRLTRFDQRSELSRLNAARSTRLHVSELMARFAEAATEAAARTNGLVDPTLVDEIETAGYRTDLKRSLPLELGLQLAPARAAAGPHPDARWVQIAVDRPRRIIARPRGTMLDSGGIAKGLFADLAADALAGCDTWAVDCCGDLRIGGTAAQPRRVRVDDPFGRGTPLHELSVTHGGVATSGIGRRSWLDPTGRAAHHLLDPATGRPAFTGIVQATAVAPTALEAETLAKAALLAGPDRAAEWLPHGGVLVFDDTTHIVVEASTESLAA